MEKALAEALVIRRKIFVVQFASGTQNKSKECREFGVEILLTAYQVPNMNAYAERFVRSIKSEGLNQMIFLGREGLIQALAEYTAHYHQERHHKDIGNVLISGALPRSERTGVPGVPGVSWRRVPKGGLS
jgi:transposase InsO family protein